jgi:hypothetical protein
MAADMHKKYCSDQAGPLYLNVTEALGASKRGLARMSLTCRRYVTFRQRDWLDDDEKSEVVIASR